jgi:hypothetical protein
VFALVIPYWRTRRKDKDPFASGEADIL